MDECTGASIMWTLGCKWDVWIKLLASLPVILKLAALVLSSSHHSSVPCSLPAPPHFPPSALSTQSSLRECTGAFPSHPGILFHLPAQCDHLSALVALVTCLFAALLCLPVWTVIYCTLLMYFHFILWSTFLLYIKLYFFLFSNAFIQRS